MEAVFVSQVQVGSWACPNRPLLLRAKCAIAASAHAGFCCAGVRGGAAGGHAVACLMYMLICNACFPMQVYEAVLLMASRQFKRAAELLLDAIATFTR